MSAPLLSLDAFSAARDKLIENTPAPDAAAILYKLELLAVAMTEADEGDALLVTALRDDARRLFEGK